MTPAAVSTISCRHPDQQKALVTHFYFCMDIVLSIYRNGKICRDPQPSLTPVWFAEEAEFAGVWYPTTCTQRFPLGPKEQKFMANELLVCSQILQTDWRLLPSLCLLPARGMGRWEGQAFTQQEPTEDSSCYSHRHPCLLRCGAQASVHGTTQCREMNKHGDTFLSGFVPHCRESLMIPLFGHHCICS